MKTPVTYRTWIERLTDPASIAIVGASAGTRSPGNFVLKNIRQFAQAGGFQGSLHLVNPKAESIEGIACVPRIADLPDNVDVAILAIPQTGLAQALRDCALRGVVNAVVFASGYAETGAEGQLHQLELEAIARETGIRILGPNCMGLTNWASGIPLTFEPIVLPRGYRAGEAGRSCIAVIAQSGAMACNIRDAMLGKALPLDFVASTGNEVDVALEDFLEHALARKEIAVVAMYAEQIRHPARFLKLARRARAMKKPLVLLMPGKSQRSRDAAQSHTGALAGDYTAAVTALEREAVLMVQTLDELFDSTDLLLRNQSFSAAGVGLLTGSGAIKNIALDLSEDFGLELPALSDDTVDQLKQLLPDYAVAENPLDYTTIGMRDPGLIGQIIETVAQDPGIGSLVLALMVGPPVAQRDKADHVLPALQRAAIPAADGSRPGKPSVLVVLGDNVGMEAFFAEAIAQSRVPTFRSLDRALRAITCIGRLARLRQEAERADTVTPAEAQARLAGHCDLPPSGVSAWTEVQAKHWLSSAGIASPPGTLAHTKEQALAAARQLGFPLVLKAQAPSLMHKSEVGGVLVNLQSEMELDRGWDSLQAAVQRNCPGLELDGVLVERMAEPGLELIIGAKRDPQWGPFLLVGLGGIWIEALKDVCCMPCDASVEDIIARLGTLKAAGVLGGLRGKPATDVLAIARMAATLGQEMLANPGIREVDLNPVMAYPLGRPPLALDALCIF